ncbi:RDD family protein [Salipaludibacillus daqingensis]|uniref:RDD family protein n=1 Tax=Salipaludibacillus daqingensis TaxID=3041001 RepID=UPI00247593C3|nr:RDD family protein [Salipaludibacillus daqingensis]
MSRLDILLSNIKPVEINRNAGGFIRLLALFYDIVVLSMVLFMVGAFTTLWMMVSTDSPFIADPIRTRDYIFNNEFHLYFINWLILGTVFIIYQYIYPMFKRQTFGMMFTDLTVVDENEQHVTKRKYFQRELLKIVLFPTFFLSFTKGRRPLYDKWSKTYLKK